MLLNGFFALNLPKQYLFQIDMNGVTLFMFFFRLNKILLPINFVGFLFSNVNGKLFEIQQCFMEN